MGRALIAALLALAGAAQAQTFTMSNGSVADMDRIDILKDSATGETFFALHVVPRFNPEPFGPVPPADAIRWHGEMCEMLVPAISDDIASNGVERLRVRWQWTPEDQPGDGITIIRFHENEFDVADCVARDPFGPRSVPPSTLGERWLGTETATDRTIDGLGYRVLYRLPESIATYDEDRLERVSLELCVSHVADEIARREELYEGLDYAWASVTFEERPTATDSFRRSFTYSLDTDGACRGGLSPLLAGAIRSQMGLD